MKINDLKLFCAIIEAGGMTQAASMLGLSQPSLSRTVRDLELKLNARLVERTGRGVELTRAGELFFNYCNSTLDAFQATQQEILNLSGSIPTELNLAVPLRTSRLMTAELMHAFAKVLPHIDIHIFEDSTDRIGKDITSGKRHFGLVYQPPVSNVLLPQTVARESLYVVGKAEMIGTARKPVSLKSLHKLPLLAPGRESLYRRFIDSCFQRKGLVMNIVRELETVDALLAFAMEGEGVSILPYSNVYQEVDRGEISARKIEKPSIDRKICLVMNKELDHLLMRQVKKIISAAIMTISDSAKWEVI